MRKVHAEAEPSRPEAVPLKLPIVLAVGLVALTIVAPVALAQPGGPCICDPSPCGPAPGIAADPLAYADWLACNVLGGYPW